MNNGFSLGRFLFIVLCQLPFCSCNAQDEEMKGSWINPSACRDDDFILFNFHEGLALKYDGSSYKLNFASGHLRLWRANDSIVTQFSEVTYKKPYLKLSYSNNQNLTLIEFEAVKSSRKIEKWEFEGAVFLEELTPPERSSRRYLQFFPTNVFLETLTGSDTIYSENRWFLHQSDSLNFINLRSAACTNIVLEPEDSGIYRILVNSPRGYEFRRIKKVDFDLFSNVNILEGIWYNKFSFTDDSNKLDAVKVKGDTIEFFDHSPFAKQGNLTNPRGRFWLDCFGKFIVTDLPAPYDRIPVEIQTDRIVITILDNNFVLHRYVER